MSAADDAAEPLEFLIAEADAGSRLDAYLARQLPRYSRTHLRRAIVEGGVLVGGRRGKPSYRLLAGERVTLRRPALPREGPEPEDIPLDVLYEDECLVAVNKPPGMVVHPAKGHWRGTLTSALAFRFEQLSAAGGPARPGIVHRLDRDTSGVILIAKTDEAHFALAAQFASRSVEKEYFALTAGVPDRDRDRIDQPIAAHPHHREKMAIRADHPTSRAAETFFEVVERFSGFAALAVHPKTGRTHQIRVHLAHLGCPVLCDRLYGGRAQITRGELLGRREPLGEDDAAVLLDRPALHARRIRFLHPVSGTPLELAAPVPGDILGVLGVLRGRGSR